MEEQDFDTFMVVLRGIVDSYEAETREAIADGEQDVAMEEADWMEQFLEFIEGGDEEEEG